MLKLFKNLNISTKMIVYFTLITSLVALLFYFILPTLLNYPPNTINTQFDKEVSIIYYIYQYLIAILAILLLFALYFKIALRDLDKWNKNKVRDLKTIKSIRKTSFSFPYRLYIILEIFPVTIVSAVLQFTGSHSEILLFKIGILVFSFATLVSSIFLIISKNVMYSILKETSDYINIKSIDKSLSLHAKLVFQLFPGILVTALLISLIGYSRLTVEKGNLLNSYYSASLSSAVQNLKSYNNLSEDLNTELSNKFLSDNDFIFIENPDGSIVTGNGAQLSHFFIKYMNELSPSHENRVYESYTIDAQGVVENLEINNQAYTIGIYYEILSPSLFYFFLLSSGLLFLFNIIILLYITRSISSDIHKVNEGIKNIISNSNDISNNKLPITSNDILGELSISFNEIQELTKNNIQKIHNNQDILMEKERLASLGQLIGGIAHNLKTPIMSISGASEGLSDLVKEYDSSIDDPEVNSQDHHDIAKDMSKWIVKIREYTEYMSDIITAVKGQAVTLNNEEDVNFTIGELLKRVDILMRHELKNALVYLNVSMNVNENLTLDGDINSLVQVINNMISNSIQAYGGKPEQNIDLVIKKDSNNLIITIKDYGAGIPSKVRDKLFKEMVTTKGKNGTGLGLYMSYSTIRGHFNGDIAVDSKEGEGTTFTITLPIK